MQRRTKERNEKAKRMFSEVVALARPKASPVIQEALDRMVEEFEGLFDYGKVKAKAAAMARAALWNPTAPGSLYGPDVKNEAEKTDQEG